MILRDYQEQAVASVLREFETVKSTLVTLPTGAGKMLVGTEVARRMLASASGESGGVLFLAHRKEILSQAHKTFEAHAGVRCEYELGDRHASEIFPADVVVASVQTLIAGRNGTRRMHKFSPFNYGLVIVDEGHHGIAASYRTIFDYFKTNPDLKFLFLTATPKRADEEALAQVCESVAFDYPVVQAVKDGWLVYPKQQLIDIQGLDFSHIRTTAGDLNAGDLAQVMEQERNLYGICDATMRELGQRKGIMFTVSVKQAEMACDICNRYRSGVAVWASGKTPSEDRDRIWRDYKEGRYQLFINVDLVSEGADVPDADLLVDGAPTKSKPRYMQRLGRIMRPLAGVVDGLQTAAARLAAISDSAKPFATVIDFVGNAGKHKLVHAVDVLGGKISDKARELIERELRKTGQAARIDELVIEAERKEREEAERLEAARKAKITGRAIYTSRMINPFDAFDVVAPPDREWNRGKRLSEGHRRVLLKVGIDPDRMTYAEGRAMVNEVFRRWHNKLSTIKQSACLKRFGYDTRNMTMTEASEIITKLRANGWRKLAASGQL